jgi:asparagine synthase (glutamine-hydrolysing)
MVPHFARRGLLGPVQRALPAGLCRTRIVARALAENREAQRFEGWFAPFTVRERSALLNGVPGHDPHLDLAPHGDALRRMLVADTAGGWLTDNLLARGDRMSMAASLELRPPFLDRDVVELAFRLPSRLKVRDGVGKWVLRQAAEGIVPAEVLRRPKLGFRLPLDAWFRSGLRDMARDRLLERSSLVGTILDRRAVTRLLDDHERGRRNEEARIWSLLSLEVWHSLFFTGSGPAAAAVAGSDSERHGVRP